MPEENPQEFIAFRPKRFLLTTPQQFEIGKEHSIILTALTEGNMSVKEIHDLYKLPDSKKHTLTLKTIYRYMDLLEEAGLVKVAGYRKYPNKRTTEKLYCRTARVFFNRSNELKEQWLTTEEGQEYIESLAQIIWRLKHTETQPPEALKTLLTKYIQETHTQVNRIIDTITTDEKLAKILDKQKLSHIQSALSLTSHIQGMLETDTRDQIKEIIISGE
jgi:Fe2+ or Zn2+ uptake regulation protein